MYKILLPPEILDIDISRWHCQIKNFVALKHICSKISFLHNVNTDFHSTKQASCTDVTLCSTVDT